MEFKVEYSKKQDSKVYLMGLWDKSQPDYGTNLIDMAKKYYPVEFIEAVKNAPSRQNANKIILNYFENNFGINFQKGNEFVSKWFERILNEEKENIISKLENIYQKDFPFVLVNVYLTTFCTCPYDFKNRSFFVYRTSNLMSLVSIATHELNHFMFHFYFFDYLKRKNISEQKILFLNEAFAVLSSDNINENQEKPKVLAIQEFIKNNKDKSVENIIDSILEKGLLDD